MTQKAGKPKTLGLKAWAVVAIPVFLISMWAAFMIGEMAVIWTDAAAWPAKKLLCPASSRPEILRTSEAGSAHGHQSTYSNKQWTLVCHGKSGTTKPSGVFWVQIGVWVLLLFPLLMGIAFLTIRKLRRL